MIEKTFNTALFLAEIKVETKHIGLKLSELAIKVKIPKKRFTCLMNDKAKFKEDEIDRINNVLGLN